LHRILLGALETLAEAKTVQACAEKWHSFKRQKTARSRKVPCAMISILLTVVLAVISFSVISSGMT